ncbi:ectonucleotide pyrophosphatase/phosphodiesterase [Lysobacter sp. CCNWLW3]|uniref:alkaline phosphatase family protein n=1 Tax=unclassified Lysobacter TaxID=2635362 RepID=UPI002FD6B76D
MRSYFPAAATALLALLLTACATRAPQPAEPVPVLLISIDGFRNDYFERGISPNLERIARDGVRADWMNPSYPSLTFPNHYSIVTGLRPDHHGIVHNSMWEDGLGVFRVADRKAVGDTRWWGGEPIWVGAEKAGLRSATLFWPGSEAPVQGLRPTRWHPFDEKVSANARVDEVLGWLGEPAATRPRVITLYFDALDKAGHEHGPDSAEANEAIVTIDAAIGRLLDGLAARDRLERVNLIVVSDHGMATVAPGHAIAVEDMVSMQEAAVVSIGQSIGIVPKPGQEAAVAAKLIGRHEHYECWRKQDLPARWHYGTHPRVPAIVCQMDEGWDAIQRSALDQRPNASRGSHGYDPALPSMRAIFLARGPAFRRGARLPAFDNVDVYPLLTRLVGIRPARNDGDIAPLLPALREPAARP